MKFVIQKVESAKVEVDKKIVGKIGKGYMVLIGIKQTDTIKQADYLVNKLVNLRIFEDEMGKLNLSLKDVDGELLLVSQFTLYGDCQHGNRPSFIEAAKPAIANELYEYIIKQCKEKIEKVETGVFGANMKVSLVNDGPTTIIMEK